jgi:hypothetical protein
MHDMKRRSAYLRYLAMVLSLSCTGVFSADERLELGHGASVLHVETAHTRPIKLRLVCFNTEQCSLAVVTQDSARTGHAVGPWLGTLSGLAMCNGGYYDPGRFVPSGLEISYGVRTGVLQQQGGHTGALVVDAAGPRLLPYAEMKDDPGIQHWVQCSPMLVEKGQALLTGNESLARRTFIATDDAGHWVMGVCSGCNLDELAAMMLVPAYLGGLKVRSALALDGGPSSALAWRMPSGEVQHHYSSATVRNAVLLVVKE